MSDAGIRFRCPACGLNYEDQAMAEACNDFCTSHKACSIEITKHAIENHQEEKQ